MDKDLVFFKEALRLLGKSVEYITLDEILQIIEQNPYVKDINYFRQKEFLGNQQAKIDLSIKERVK